MRRMTRKHRVHPEPQTSTVIEGAARSGFSTCINRDFMWCIDRCWRHVTVKAAQNLLGCVYLVARRVFPIFFSEDRRLPRATRNNS